MAAAKCLSVAGVALPPNELGRGLAYDLLQGLSQGFGQVMFQGNWITGVLFFVGILVASPRNAIWAFAGSAVGFGFGWLCGLPADALAIGLYGYNAVLCAIALDRAKTHAIVVIISVCLSVVLTRAM